MYTADSEAAYEENCRCAVCGSAELDSLMVRLGAAKLVECAACKSWTLVPRLGSEGQSALHDTERYFNHQYFRVRRRITEALHRRVRATFLRIASAIALPALRGERVLDVGCDTGEFLYCATEEFGILPVGIDVSSRAIQQATKRNIEAYATDLAHAPEHLKDLALIMAIDLIEHVADPREFLKQVYKRLRPRGVAYVETPNAASVVYSVGRLFARSIGGRWQKIIERLFPTQHAQYFTKTSLAGLATACGFEVVRIVTRVLPFQDISAPLPTRLGLALLQTEDVFTGEQILLCATLRRPK